MSKLTKEYFEQTLKTALAPLATKQDVREGVEKLARITSGGFDRTKERFDQIKERLNVNELVKTIRAQIDKA